MNVDFFDYTLDKDTLRLHCVCIEELLENLGYYSHGLVIRVSDR